MKWLLILLCCAQLAAVEITLEHAVTPEERALGLMGRRELAENHGMLFHYPKPQRASIWMFGCYIDLSVAFLDGEGRIMEIHELKAYPEMLDPERGCDVSLYRYNDPVCRFFRQRTVRSEKPVLYALEMPAGWFARHHFSVGDSPLPVAR